MSNRVPNVANFQLRLELWRNLIFNNLRAVKLQTLIVLITIDLLRLKSAGGMALVLRLRVRRRSAAIDRALPVPMLEFLLYVP
jgi:hypothetical protein